ncbi:MAG: MucR family transcriptional regulator [Desulfobacterales bacterium]|nr:MucR family transcriptional regulator [Desulfobacterales bacterium]
MKDTKKKHKSFRLLPGYPMEGKLRTKEEVDAHFSGDKIQCLLCGKWFKALGTHLLRQHDVTHDEYRERYGLPWTRGLTGRATFKKNSGRMKRMISEGRVVSDIEKANACRKGTQKPAQPFNRDAASKNIRMVHNKPPIYRQENYEAVADRMREQGRSLKDVCRDPDLPAVKSCRRHMRKDPGFKKKIQQAYYSMPYSLQHKYRKVSPQFLIECQWMRAKRMSYAKIAKALGVNRYAVVRTLRSACEKMDQPKKTKRGTRESPPGSSAPFIESLHNRWHREDYEAVIDRALKQGRGFKDVCGDPDLPGHVLFHQYFRSHPGFKEKVKRACHRMPYSRQFSSHNVSPRFLKDYQRLQARGLTLKEISRSLGVTKSAFLKYLRNTPGASGIKASAKEGGARAGRESAGPGGRLGSSPRTKWQWEDYEAVVARMRKQKRTLGSVLKDRDLPGVRSWWVFSDNHPEFKEKVKEIHHSMPYSTQVQMNDVSPRFLIDCRQLRAKGMSLDKIAKALGVSISTVKIRMREAGLKTDRPPHLFVPETKWKREDFEAILERMLQQARGLWEVCKDPDLPASSTIQGYLKKHPEFNEKLQQTYFRFPYSKQVACRKISPRFRVDCQRLHARGMIEPRIAKALGVPRMAVRRVLKDAKKG